MCRDKIIMRAKYWALFAVWMLLCSCAVSPTGRTQFIIISPDAAIIESEAAYMDTVRQLDDEDKLVGNPLTVARVARITGRLVSIAVADFSTSADWKWSVAIVDDAETVNAWCMAGVVWQSTQDYLTSSSSPMMNLRKSWATKFRMR